MKTKYFVGLFLLMVLLFACTKQVELDKINKTRCNFPYFEYKTGECCLDKNNNSVCDGDEKIEMSDEEKLEEVARKFARTIVGEKWGELYSLLTPERQSYKTQEEFVGLYSLIYQTRYSSILFKQLEIENENGFISYDITYSNGFKETVGPYYFKKVNEIWYFDGYSDIIYAGCFENSDCYKNDDKLMITCEETCKQNTPNELRDEEGKEFSCDRNVCHCICWNETTQSGTHIAPDWKFVH